MSRGESLVVSVMYSLRAPMRWGLVHSVASRPREETSFSRRSGTIARAQQARMACWNVSGPVPQQGQVRSGFSSKEEGSVAR